jgi:dihydrofolate synthase/folylpolyglutamate synthase
MRMTYEAAIKFWYGRINYEVRSARPADLKLERMSALLRMLGNPQERVRLVHVTGTKGKGSTCAMLASIARAAGYRVGLFTSPHLERVEERAQVDGEPISPDEVAARMSEVAPAVHELERSSTSMTGGSPPGLTFFEIGTALGFLHFCRRRCDIAIIEVGLGGRFDSTNVCRPLVSVITSVGFDHMAQLGNTPEAIAYQKAGIIKKRVPVISGVTQEGPRAVIRKEAAEQDAPLRELGENFGYDCETVPSGSSVTISTEHAAYPRVHLNLLGAHQAHNAALAVAACEELHAAGLSIPDQSIVRGLGQVHWPARIEVLHREPVVILDTAHNVPSAEALVGTLGKTFTGLRHKAVVFAVSSDKQYVEILRVLADYFDHFHLTRYGNNPRGVPPEKLAAALEEIAPGKPFTIHHTALEAWTAARSTTRTDDLVCVTGSVFLAGELRSEMCH